MSIDNRFELEQRPLRNTLIIRWGISEALSSAKSDFVGSYPVHYTRIGIRGAMSPGGQGKMPGESGDGH